MCMLTARFLVNGVSTDGALVVGDGLHQRQVLQFYCYIAVRTYDLELLSFVRTEPC